MCTAYLGSYTPAPENVAAPWSAEDDAALWYNRDDDLEALAARFERLPGGIERRLAKLFDAESPASKRLFGDDDDDDAAVTADDDYLRLDDVELLRQCDALPACV